ncbi:AKAP7 2'5' RNA ligase-like domain-containing protein [Hyaloraphidium curvatum]|nr:AKAP7 2'5' RNA ligase-like domain-containing protein [Hyaloraphidium curvatum]
MTSFVEEQPLDSTSAIPEDASDPQEKRDGDDSVGITEEAAQADADMAKVVSPLRSISSGARKTGRPDHFLSLRLSASSFAPFHDWVKESHPDYAQHLVLPSTIHLTLGLLSLGDDERRERAVKCLLECQSIASRTPSFGISLRGLGHFGRRVVYANPEEGAAKEELLALAASLQVPFRNLGLLAADGQTEVEAAADERAGHPYQGQRKPREPKPLVLHATMMKIRGTTSGRSKGKKGGDVSSSTFSQAFVREALERFADHSFGEHQVERIDLCVMTRKQDDGYYQVLGDSVSLKALD